VRRLVALARHLPDDAYIWGYHGWSIGHELAAATVEKEHDVLRILQAMAGIKPAKRAKALRIPRPFEEEKRSRKPAARAWLEWARRMTGG